MGGWEGILFVPALQDAAFFRRAIRAVPALGTSIAPIIGLRRHCHMNGKLHGCVLETATLASALRLRLPQVATCLVLLNSFFFVT